LALKLGGDKNATNLSNACYVFGVLSDPKTIDYCNRAIAISPNNPYAYYERSQLRRKLGLTQSADEDLETYTKLKKTGSGIIKSVSLSMPIGSKV
jgi:regulator of sirC expression with transglutaminase-like and TPR domain